jgi:hypothetical protein
MRPHEDSLADALGIDIGGVIIDRVHEDRAGAPARDPGYASAMPMDQASVERRPERAAALTSRA